MKLKTTCRNCRKEFDLKKTYSSRPDMIQEMGEEFNLQCTHCLTTKSYHVNDIKAYQSNAFRLIGTLVGLLIIGVFTIFYLVNGVLTNIGFIVGGLVIAASNAQSLMSNVNAFNGYKIRRNY